MMVSPVRRHTGAATLEQLYSTGTTVSLSHRYTQQPSREAFQTSPCARGTPELSVQAANRQQSYMWPGKLSICCLRYWNWLLTTLLRWDAEGRIGPVEERPLGADAALCQA